MIRKNIKNLRFFNRFADWALTLLSYYAAVFIRFGVMHGRTRVTGVEFSNILKIMVFAILVVIAYEIAGLYENYRYTSSKREYFKVFVINLLSVFVLWGTMYLTKFPDFSRLAIGMFYVFSSFLVCLKRYAVKTFLKLLRTNRRNLKHVLVVGCGRNAEGYSSSLEDNPELGFQIDGYFGSREGRISGKYLGDYSELESFLNDPDANLGINELIIAIENDETDVLPKIMAIADKEGIGVSLVPFYNEYIPAKLEIVAVGSSKLINLRATPMEDPLSALIKRAADIVISALILLLFSPMMLAVAIGVKLSSPGPVFFVQERVGKGRKPFKMYKFRSMLVTDVENTAWTTGTDPRKTRFGSFIRKYSIDEFPQFFNVLKGDMSLVGPRPEIPFHVSHFKEEIPRYLVRQQVKPGITGWAQVNGYRGDTSISERIRYDIWYIENWTIGLDIRILFLTVFGGFINSEKAADPQLQSEEENTI